MLRRRRSWRKGATFWNPRAELTAALDLSEKWMKQVKLAILSRDRSSRQNVLCCERVVPVSNAVPQSLKPRLVVVSFGTAEAVPSHES
jgi:hypothetical protein